MKPRPAPANPVPSFGFDSSGTSMEEALQVWRSSVQLLFDVEPDDSAPFHLAMHSYKIGPILFGRTRSSAQRFIRDEQVIARGGDHHVLVQLYVSGGYQGDAAGLPIRVRPGDICVLDLAATFRTEAGAFDNLTMAVPRALLGARLPNLDNLHGVVLPHDRGMTRLLGRHLLAIDEIAPELEAPQADELVDATLALLAATLVRAESGNGRGEAIDGSLPLAIRRHIDANLADPALGASAIARHFGVSRATLYRLFAGYGSISDYIRREWLRRSLQDLRADTGKRAHVGRIARRWGFGSDASFARAFRATYGVSPTNARNIAEREVEGTPNTLVDWFSARDPSGPPGR